MTKLEEDGRKTIERERDSAKPRNLAELRTVLKSNRSKLPQEPSGSGWFC